MRIFAVILLTALLLCSCGQTAPSTTTTQTTTENVQADVTKPNAFSLANSYASLPVGKNLVSFSSEGSQTRITMISPEDGEILSSVTVGEDLSGNISSVRANSTGICYYSTANNCLTFLNTSLEEVRRLRPAVPHVGILVLSENWKNAYYSDGTSVINMNLESGLSTKVSDQSNLTLLGSFYNGQALILSDEAGNPVYISANDGSAVKLNGDSGYLRSDAKCSITQLDSNYLITDTSLSKTWLFNRTADELYPLSERSMIVSVDFQKDQTAVDFWDLETGASRGQYMLPALQSVYGIVLNAEENRIWICGIDIHSKNYITSINVDAIKEKPSLCGFKPYYTEENPDVEGLAFCQEKFDKLSEKYPVKITIGGDFSRYTGDYTFTENYKGIDVAPMITRLTNALSLFPEGFLEKALSDTNDQTLHIVLYRTVESRLPQHCPGALAYYDGNYYLALPTDDTMVHAFLHGVGHLVANWVRIYSLELDEWTKINPYYFSYTMEYACEDETYLSEDDRYFPSLLAMTYPMEDYAEIFAYSLLPEGEEMFQSEAMQEKLYRMYKGIRGSFGLKRDPRVFAWETYLD